MLELIVFYITYFGLEQQNSDVALPGFAPYAGSCSVDLRRKKKRSVDSLAQASILRSSGLSVGETAKLWDKSDGWAKIKKCTSQNIF